MNINQNSVYMRIGYAAVLVALVAIFSHWSWMTLAEYFSAPVPGFKDTVSLLILLGMARWVLHRPNRPNHVLHSDSKV
jgi:hypothetical protein